MEKIEVLGWNGPSLIMPAFIDQMGEERGAILLKDARIHPEYNASFNIDAHRKNS